MKSSNFIHAESYPLESLTSCMGFNENEGKIIAKLSVAEYLSILLIYLGFKIILSYDPPENDFRTLCQNLSNLSSFSCTFSHLHSLYDVLGFSSEVLMTPLNGSLQSANESKVNYAVNKIELSKSRRQIWLLMLTF